MKIGKFNWRINQEIRSPEVRVIGTDGKQIGVMKREEALAKAKEKDLELVEVGPNANPPVVKIVNLGKFKYEQEKKLKESKRTKAGNLKEVRFSPFIAEHDFNIRVLKIKDFLGKNYKVRVTVVFTGKQMESKSFGYDILNKVLKELNGSVYVDMEPKFLGRHLVMIISPVKSNKNKNL